ncbi:MAG TPA: hypothetical protein P5340_02365 [Defluviicoccus sp.]|nr:hypothetical protein [Defluviicoccus sp.]
MRPHRWLAFTAVLALWAAFGSTAAAHDDQERAREAAAAGRILPLAVIVERAIARFGGSVLDVEYEDDDEGEHGGDRGRPRYGVKLLTADGRILKLDYDAATGDLIGHRRRARDRHGRGKGEDD